MHLNKEFSKWTDYIDLQIKERDAVVEKWCEQSLTDPEGRGVLIIHKEDGSMLIGLSATVPSATIEEHLS